MGRSRKYDTDTPKRMVVRLELDEWEAFKQAASERKTNPTEAVRAFVQRYNKRRKAKA